MLTLRWTGALVNVERAEKRRRVMKRSMTLGHCICDPKLGCPCPEFKSHDVCHCAGERGGDMGGNGGVVEGEGSAREIRLTELVRAAGCASKIGKGVLHEVLKGLPELADPQVLVGSNTGDDAGVIMLSEETATIFTVDVFAPVVDDPYTFGQIAAANSLSDIYAMGGVPQAALSVIGYPIEKLPAAGLREILRGGAEKMKEAGVPVIGGHSINDGEVKCGYAVIGTTPRGRFVRNSGAEVGDVLVLTKPLGCGIVAFGRQIGRAGAEAVAQATRSMASLNRVAGELMVRHGAHAATDVTGFGLLGHLVEIVRQSQVEVELEFARLPLFKQVAELAAQDVLPGAVERNREGVDGNLLDLTELTAGEQGILFGPETSGGMLVLLAAAAAERFGAELQARGISAACVIGRVVGANPAGRIRVKGSGRTAGAQAGRGVEEITNMEKSSAQINGSQVVSKGAEETVPACCSHGVEGIPSTVTNVGAPEDGKLLPAAAGAEAFRAYMAAVNAPGALGVKEKKLIGLALSIVSRCEPCVKLNAQGSRAAGATYDQIAEAAALGNAFGGAAANMFYQKCRD